MGTVRMPREPEAVSSKLNGDGKYYTTAATGLSTPGHQAGYPTTPGDAGSFYILLEFNK
jgi:hypothetical protein